MARKPKILVWLAALALFAAVLFFAFDKYADQALTGIADHYLKKELAKADSLSLSYSHLDYSLATGRIKVKNISFSYPAKNIDGFCKSLELGSLKPLRVYREKQIDLDFVRINAPRLFVNLKEKNKDKDSAAVLEAGESAIVKYIKSISVKRIDVNDGSLSLKGKGNKTSLAAGDLDLSFFDVDYGLENKKLTYCDSLYRLSASKIAYVSKDSLYRLDVDSLQTKDAGGVFLKGIHGRNTTHKTHLAAAKGKVPVTWSDLKAKSLRTSSVNIFRTVLHKSISVDSVFIEGDKMTTYRDARYSPKKSFPMPQESILKIPLPLHIGTFDLRVTYYNLEVRRPEGSAGTLSLHDMGLKISNLSNAPEHTNIFCLTPRLGKGRGEITLHLKNDSQCSFYFNGSASNVSVSDFGGLIGPLFGVSATGSIHSLKTSFSGNKHSAKGDFCLLYDNLDLEIDAEKTPISFLSKHGKLLDFLEGGLIHRQNPRKLKKETYTCTVNANRDPMKNFGNYLLTVVLDGVEQTVLDKMAYKLAKKTKDKKENVIQRIKDKKENIKDRIEQKREKRQEKREERREKRNKQ